MTRQRISKKIFIYFLLFFILGTFNNKKFSQIYFFKETNLNIIDQSDIRNNEIIKDLSFLQNNNLFSLKKNEVLDIISSHQIVENFFVFKNYPSNLNVKIETTKFLAITNKKGINYYIGANGKLISTKDKNKNLPFIFGDIDIDEFLNLKEIIDNSSFNFDDILNFYYFRSKRWDIETKNGIIINLPKENLGMSFEILLNILSKNEFKKFKKIDLRQNNQVILND